MPTSSSTWTLVCSVCFLCSSVLSLPFDQSLHPSNPTLRHARTLARTHRLTTPRRPADLTTLFNWNTKQVFLYVKAVYPSLTPTEPASEAIIWDAILPGASAPWDQRHFVHPDPKSKTPTKKSRLPKVSKKKAAALAAAAPKPASPFPAGALHLATQRPKYQITDISGKLQNRTDVVLQVGWNVQPWVGALTWTNWETVGVWKGFVGGVSEAFAFPEIGKKTVVDKKDLETEKGGEGYRLEVGGEAPRRKTT